MFKLRHITHYLLASILILASGCFGGPEYYPQAIAQILWSPDQSYLAFTYSNLRKYPPPGTPTGPAYVQNLNQMLLYRINTDGTNLKQLFDPIKALNKKGDKVISISLIGWKNNRLLIYVDDNFYLLDPETEALTLIAEVPDLDSQHLCYFQNHLVLDDPSTHESVIIDLSNPSNHVPIHLASQTDDLHPTVFSCSQDGKLAFYELRSITSALVAERGIAELNYATGDLEKPKVIPFDPNQPLKDWYRFVAWTTSQTIEYQIVLLDPINKLGTDSEIFQFDYQNGVQKKITNDFLEKHSPLFISPSYTKIAYVNHPFIQISDTDGNNSTQILNFIKKLPKGELTYIN